MWSNTFSWGWVVLTMFLLSACGYQFSVEGVGPTIGGGKPVSSGPPMVLAVRNFENHTFHPHLENKYTSYFRQEFTTNSGADVVYEERDADFLMKGEIVSVTLPSLTFTPNQTRETRVQVVVRVTVENQKTGKLLWSRSGTGTGEYLIGATSSSVQSQDTLQFNRVLQERALEQAGQNVAQQLADDFWVARDEGKFNPPPPTPEQPQQAPPASPSPKLRGQIPTS